MEDNRRETAEQQCRKLIALMTKERRRQRMTLESLGENSGVASATIEGWIYMKRQPSLRNFLQVLDALGLEMGFRRKKKDEPEKPD